MLRWSNLTTDDKHSLVNRLQSMRLTLLKESQKKRASRGKRQPKPIVFASDAHKALFDKMPPEVRRYITGR